MSPRVPILVTGCQRSGTTLLGLVLNSHPQIRCIDEDQFDLPCLYRYLHMPGPSRFAAFKLPRYAHLLQHLQGLPGARFVWCIRDPFDTVASMVKLKLETGSSVLPWSVHAAGGWYEVANCVWLLGDRQRTALEPHMARFFAMTEQLARLSASSSETLPEVDRHISVFIAALCWRIKNELPHLYDGQGIDYHVNRYEELVNDPRGGIAKLLAYAGAEWHDDVLAHHRLHQGTSIGETDNTRAIDRRSLGTGRTQLTPDEQAVVWDICGPAAQQWGYGPA